MRTSSTFVLSTSRILFGGPSRIRFATAFATAALHGLCYQYIRSCLLFLLAFFLLALLSAKISLVELAFGLIKFKFVF